MQQPQEILSAKLPKHFLIPSKNRFISVGQYMQLYRFCKENPGLEVKETICSWAGGTTGDVLNEIRKGVHERIYLRQFLTEETMATKTKPAESKKPPSQKDTILQMITEHNKTVDAVLKDYLVTDGAELEVLTAGDNLHSAVEEVLEEEQDEDVEALYKKLSNLDPDEFESEQLEKIAGLFNDDHKIDFIRDFAVNNGYALVKVDSMDKQEKLREFVEAEIWPSYNDQQENLII